MLLKKKVSLGFPFAKKKPYEYEGTQYEADIKDGDLVTIMNSGAVVVGQYGEQHTFVIKTRNGDKALTFNQSTINNLVDAYSEDTEAWKGKDAKVWAIKAMVSGKMQTVVYLAEPSWTMDDEGRFMSPNKPIDPEYPTDEINADEITFD